MISVYPFRIAADRSIVAVSGPVENIATNPLIKRPPTKQLRIGHGDRRPRTKAPDVPFVRNDAVEFIDPPVVRRVQIQWAGRIGRVGILKSDRRVVHIVEIVAEVHRMHNGPQAGRPAKLHVGIDKSDTIGWVGIVSLLRWNGEIPDRTLPGAVRVRVVDLIDSPIVRCARYQTIRIGKARKTGYVERRRLVASERFTLVCTIVYAVKAIPHIDIVRDGFRPRRPREIHPCIRIQRPISRIGTVSIGIRFTPTFFDDELNLFRQQCFVIDVDFVNDPRKKTSLVDGIPTDTDVRIVHNVQP